MNDERPVAVMDSGVGGISVLRQLVCIAPEENYVFFGDSANAPYGTKSEKQVLALAQGAAERLLALDAKALVIACNTATSVAADTLRAKYPAIPIIGMEPAVKPASKWGEYPSVLVMATPLTLKREKFLSLLHRYDSDARLCPTPCPGLVELIESGADHEKIRALLRWLLLPVRDQLGAVDAVVLGCTHYPLVRDDISAVLAELFDDEDERSRFSESLGINRAGDLSTRPRADAFAGKIAIFDGCRATASETVRRLHRAGVKRTSVENGTVSMYSSSSDPSSAALAHSLIAAVTDSLGVEVRDCGILS